MDLEPDEHQADEFLDCVTLGIYDDILKQMESANDAALANQEYQSDFFRAAQPDRRNSYQYLNKSGDEFVTILFGQICHSSYGSRIGAAGSYSRLSTVSCHTQR